MCSPTKYIGISYNDVLKGLEGRSSDYHRYLSSDGLLTPFQRKKIQEKREADKKRKESHLLRQAHDTSSGGGGTSSQHLVLSEEEQSALRELVEVWKVTKMGFFLHDECVEKYSLRMLFRCRCWQLGIRIDQAVDTQLPSSPSRDECRSITALDFSTSYLAPRGLMAVGAVLGYCTELQSLRLSGVGITALSPPESANADSPQALHFVMLMKALERCKKLEYLDLSCNFIHDYYSSYIMQCIFAHPFLLEINLENSGLCELVRKKASRLLEDQKKKNHIG